MGQPLGSAGLTRAMKSGTSGSNNRAGGDDPPASLIFGAQTGNNPSE
jgi:hypothetical protein